jgi:uncharacterized protein (TIGR02996 family)
MKCPGINATDKEIDTMRPYAERLTDQEWAEFRPFLRAVLNKLSDDLPKKIAADWLEDHGEHSWAAEIRHGCEKEANKREIDKRREMKYGDELTAAFERQERMRAEWAASLPVREYHNGRRVYNRDTRGRFVKAVPG